jgi:hypothetical protein
MCVTNQQKARSCDTGTKPEVIGLAKFVLLADEIPN